MNCNFLYTDKFKKEKVGEEWGPSPLPPPLFPDDTGLLNLFCVISTELKKHCRVTDSRMTSLHRKTTVFILKIFKKILLRAHESIESVKKQIDINLHVLFVCRDISQ